MDIAYARRIIGAGAGAAGVRPLVEELAQLLDASIGTTRVMVDDGHMPKSRMIGQTGKTVTPEVTWPLASRAPPITSQASSSGRYFRQPGPGGADIRSLR